MPKDRGAEQGDVDGPLECSLALGMVAAETRGRVAAQQASGSLPWIGVDDPSGLQRLQADCAVRLQETTNFQFAGPGKFTGADDPRHVMQKRWMGDILCHPILVPAYSQDFDDANAKVGAERHPQKTGVIYYVNDLGAAPPEWRVDDVQNMAKVSAVTAGTITLGVGVGPRRFIADQLLAKADVSRAMHERVQLCQDPQTEFALLGARPHDPAGATSRNL